MSQMSSLLGQAINSIIDVKEESDLDSFLAGNNVSFSANEIKGLDDFEQICFLVIKDSEEVSNKKNYRLVAAGSRNFNDYSLLCTTLNEVVGELKSEYNVTIVSGTANGADKLGDKYDALMVERFISWLPSIVEVEMCISCDNEWLNITFSNHEKITGLYNTGIEDGLHMLFEQQN